MSNQSSQEQIRSHSLARFLNDAKLANLDAKGREIVSLSLELANWQMRAACNNRGAELNRIDRELAQLAQERDSSSREYADWIEKEQPRLERQKMQIRAAIARAKEQGVYKDHSALRDAVDTGKPIPEGTELPFFLTEAIEFVEIHGSPDNNSNRGAALSRWMNPTLWYLLIRDVLFRS